MRSEFFFWLDIIQGFLFNGKKENEQKPNPDCKKAIYIIASNIHKQKK
jgi:hypothetical protein